MTLRHWGGRSRTSRRGIGIGSWTRRTPVQRISQPTGDEEVFYRHPSFGRLCSAGVKALLREAGQA